LTFFSGKQINVVFPQFKYPKVGDNKGMYLPLRCSLGVRYYCPCSSGSCL